MEFNSNYLISIHRVICKNVIESKKWFTINIYIKKNRQNRTLFGLLIFKTFKIIHKHAGKWTAYKHVACSEKKNTRIIR